MSTTTYIPKVSIVNYTNTKPLLLGLEAAQKQELIDLKYNYPAQVAQDLITGQVDIALIPVATIPLVNNPHIIGHYGIASEHKVASVCIFSNVPIEDVTCLLLDYQSRTSIKLAQVLIEEYWKLDIELKPAQQNYIEEIVGTTAGVIIGDRALKSLDKYEFVYDLSEIWNEWTGLPFVFAIWVSNKALDDDFIKHFDEWNAEGVNNVDKIIKDIDMDYYSPSIYFKENIKYSIGTKERAGLTLFLNKINPEFSLNFEQ